MPDTYDVVIVGGGPAGLAAALYASRGLHSTIVIEKATPGGLINNTERVDDYPGHPDGMRGPALAEAMFEQGMRFGAKSMAAEALAIEPQGEHVLVRTTNGEVLGRTVIIATGGVRRTLGVPGERELAGKGMGTYSLHDAQQFAGKHVVIVGGGDTAFSEAVTLARTASQVTIVHRRSTFRAIEVLQEQVRALPNVKFVLNSTVVAILGTSSVTGVSVEDVATGAASQIEAAGVFVHIGYRPNTDWVAQLLPVQSDGAVPTDEWMTTPLRGVYVAGDVRANSVQQVISAAGDGATAAIGSDHYLSGAE